MLNTQYVTLSMIPSGVMPVLYCSQYDVGRPLGFVVNNGSEVVNLDQYMVAIEGTRSDGTGIVADVNTDGNIGVFLTTATMTNKSDIYDMQLVIRSTDTHRVASIPFMMNVRTAALDENSSVIEEDKSLFQQYTETVMIALAEIRTDVESEATARSNADSALLEKINIEAADRAAEDTALNDRIDNIIAPGGAPSAAEVTDARLGADGVLYDTLGEAIRTQFDDVYKNLAYTVNLESDPTTGLLVVDGGIGGTVPTSLTATLEPQQTGSGAPSADNIRPFVQFTSLSMLHAGESGGGGSGNPPVTPFFGGTQNCITGEWTLYQYNSNYSGITDMTGVRWWSDRDVYVAGTNPSVGAYVVYEPSTPMRSSGQAWGAEAMYPGINQYKMLAYDSVTQTQAAFTLNIETDVANVGDVIDGIADDVNTLQSDMDQTNQALTLLRNEYDITASTVVTHTTLIENNTEGIEENTADIAENAQEISLVKSHLQDINSFNAKKVIVNTESLLFVQGGITSTGGISTATTRMRSSFIQVTGDEVFYMPDNAYQIVVEIYNDDTVSASAYVKEIGGWANRLQLDGTSGYALVMGKRVDGAVVTQLDLATAASVLEVYKPGSLYDVKYQNANQFGIIETDITGDEEQVYDTYHPTSWQRGLVNAINGGISTGNGAVCEKHYADQYIFADGCYAVIRLFRNDTYLGKLNTLSSGIDKAAGNWKTLTGTVDIGRIIAQYHATHAQFAIAPTDGTAITTDNVAEYGNTHVTIKQLRFLNKNAISANELTTFVYSINHRGYSVEAPEDTIPAYILSKKKGFSWVENDIVFTFDNVPVMLHDDTINRTGRNADGSAIAETINVSDITYAQLQTYDFGIWKGEIWAGTKCPSLSEYLVACKYLALNTCLDIKRGVTEAQLDIIMDTVEATNMTEHVMYGAWSAVTLGYIRTRFPNAILALGVEGSLTAEEFTAKITAIQSLQTATGKAYMSVAYTLMSQERYTECESAHVPVILWTINSYELLDALNRNVIAVMSDSLDAGRILMDSLLIQLPNSVS